MITFVVQLVQTLMYKFDLTAYPIICGLDVQLYVRGFILAVKCCFNGFDYIYPIVQGISTAIAIVRVEYAVDNKTSNTIMHIAASGNNDTCLP